jgi:SAM-dependent methyltransferase
MHCRYYNLLYEEKDYAGEARYVTSFLPDRARILELGCGTCRHARHLAEMGHFLYCVDSNREMLGQAVPHDNLVIREADLRTLRLGPGSFDAVIALYNVFNLLETDEDVEAFFRVAGHHLRPGGTLLFDSWYRPGVLALGTYNKILRLQKGPLTLVRLSEPVYRDESKVRIRYSLYVHEGEQVHHLEQLQQYRWWSVAEVQERAARFGFTVRHHLRWNTQQVCQDQDWNVCFVLHKALVPRQGVSRNPRPLASRGRRG